MNSGLTSHQQRGHTETGPRFKSLIRKTGEAGDWMALSSQNTLKKNKTEEGPEAPNRSPE